jgi:uroporphyrinogen III methyltransferase/synthase
MLTLFTGHEDPTKPESSLDYAKLAQADGVKIMLMGIGRIGAIMGRLQNNGADAATPVALIRWATTGRQKTLVGTIGNIAAEVKRTGFKAPAVCVIGGTVTLRDKLRWFDNRPLFGRRIVVTRTREQAGELSRRLAALGADVSELPTIRIAPPQNLMAFGETVEDAHTYDWIIFSSPNGVKAYFDLFFKVYLDARALGGPRLAVIGPGTEKKLREYHFAADFRPENSVAESFVKEFVEAYGTPENQKMLWVHGEQARPIIAAEFGKMGAILDEGIAYRTLPETEDRTGAQARFREDGADIITFASSSAVDHFMELKLPLPKGIKIVSIGPVTSEALKRHQLPISIEATTHDIPGLVDAVCSIANT